MQFVRDASFTRTETEGSVHRRTIPGYTPLAFGELKPSPLGRFQSASEPLFSFTLQASSDASTPTHSSLTTAWSTANPSPAREKELLPQQKQSSRLPTVFSASLDTSLQHAGLALSSGDNDTEAEHCNATADTATSATLAMLLFTLDLELSPEEAQWLAQPPPSPAAAPIAYMRAPRCPGLRSRVASAAGASLQRVHSMLSGAARLVRPAVALQPKWPLAA